MMAVDAFVDVQIVAGGEWWRAADPSSRKRDLGPWSVARAREIARAIWRRAKRRGIVTTRVVDTDGVVVEQWPK